MRQALIVLALALGAFAGEKEDLLKAAVEAKLKLGDLLREKGDLPGALKAYNEAAALWDRHTRSEFVEDKPVDPNRPIVGGKPWVRGGVAGRNHQHNRAPKMVRFAVDRGLKWLSDHQDGDGRWDADDFMKHDPAGDQCTGAGGALFDVGGTGLSLLAFLGAGFTDRGSVRDNQYAKTVRMGLRYLMTVQDKDGVFGSRASQHWIYNHAIATAAMCDAYALTRNPRYRGPATRGLEFILQARNPHMAWRYGARPGENDTSVTAWCIAALRSGQAAGLPLRVDDAYLGAQAWLDKVTDPATGVAGYNRRGGTAARPQALHKKFPPEKTQAMTAAAVYTRIASGQPVTHPLIRKGVRRCLELPPAWDIEKGRTDMYYWYFATLAMHHAGGGEWAKWNRLLSTAAIENQTPKGSGSPTGSWDPVGPWQFEGGRIYSTALMVLALETSYRETRKP
ncbi:MAG: prenyltransferase/squalene oxidase repeat-containing protein [Planctomycetota bacterium]|jgi:hypothetical protein